MGKVSKNRVKTYYMGSRFTKYRIVAYLLCTIVIFSFCFIYDYLFPNFGIGPFFALFMLIEIAVMFLIHKASEWVIKNYYYEVSDQGLTLVVGKRSSTYLWKEFTSFYKNDLNYFDLCPFVYVVKGRKITINSYIDNPWALNVDIMDHIRDHVEIDEELYHRTTLMGQ